MLLNEKTIQLLGYLSKEHNNATVTVLMKLCYLIDLTSLKSGNGKITDFEYRRYNYGPFDDKIYKLLTLLTVQNILFTETEYTTSGNDCVVYKFNEKSNFNFDQLSEIDYTVINESINELRGLGAKILTKIAYQTKPMLKFGATLGGNEHFNEVLDLEV